METGKAKTRLVAVKKGASSRWRPAISVGIKEIDQQHRVLITLAGELREAIAAGKPKDEVGALLARLVNFAGSHFEWEEGQMASSGFEGYSEHAREHAELLEQAKLVQREFSTGEISPSRGVTLFLEVWAEHHIASSDRRLAEFMKGARTRKLSTDTASPQRKKRGIG